MSSASGHARGLWWCQHQSADNGRLAAWASDPVFIEQTLGAGDISQYLFLTYAKRVVLSYNQLNGSLASNANYISGYVRPAAAKHSPHGLQCRPELWGRWPLQVVALDNNLGINGSYPDFLAYRAQSLPTAGLSTTCAALLDHLCSQAWDCRADCSALHGAGLWWATLVASVWQLLLTQVALHARQL